MKIKFLMLIVMTLSSLVFASAATQIYNCSDLQNMQLNLSGNYELAKNISCNVAPFNIGAGFMPVGNTTNPFAGSFDGKNNNINGLFINRSGRDYVGLFGYTEHASIINVGLINVKITGSMYTGSLAGFAFMSYIEKCYATGTVIGTKSGDAAVGGLLGLGAGDNPQHFRLIDSYAKVSVTASGSNYVGGLVGIFGDKGRIYNCYATGNVTGNFVVGGLVGLHGGVGDPGSQIYRTYSTGNVTGYRDVGGLIGATHGGHTYYSYAAGTVTGQVNVGGVVGINQHGAVMEYCYWDMCRTNQTNCCGGEWNANGCVDCFGKNNITNPDTNYFYNTSNAPMNSWAFETVWNSNCSPTSGYPILTGLAGQSCKKNADPCRAGEQEAIPEINNAAMKIFVLLIVALLIGAMLLRKK